MRVVVIDDSPDYRTLMKKEIGREFPDAEFLEVADDDGFQRVLKEPGVDVVVTDFQLHWTDGLRILEEVRRERPEVPVVMATDSGNEEIAVNGMKAGLSDYVLKRDLRRLPISVEESIKKKQSEVRLAEAYSDMEQRVRERTKQLEFANRELRGVLLVTDSALTTLELEPLLETLLDRLREVTGADIAVALLKDDDQLIFTAVSGIDRSEVDQHRLRIGEGFAGVVAQSGESLYVDNASDDPRILAPWVHRLGVSAMLGSPMRRGNELVGVLHIDWLQPHPYDPAEQHMLEVSADRVAFAITNAQLFQRTQRAENLGEALNRINVSVTATLDAGEMIRRALRKAAEAIGCESAMAATRNDALWEVTHVFRLPRNVAGSRYAPSDLPYAQFAGERRRPVHVPDVEGGQTRSALLDQVGARSSLVVPLFVREQVHGAMYFNYHTDRVSFDQEAREFAQKVAYSLSLGLENAQLYAAERDIADTLQEAVLTIPASVPGLRFGHLYRSATEAARVGGDFYDVLELPDDKIGLLVGDVSGKGLPAAAMTSLVRDTIRAYAYEHLSPAQIMYRTNGIVADSSLESSFVTVFLGILDRDSGAFVYCNAGHMPTLHVTPRGIDILEATGSVVGAFDEMRFDEERIVLDRGDLLFMYTDGLTEARHRVELYGERRVIDSLKANLERPIEELPEAMLAAVLAFTGGGLGDDLAMLAVSRA